MHKGPGRFAAPLLAVLLLTACATTSGGGGTPTTVIQSVTTPPVTTTVAVVLLVPVPTSDQAAKDLLAAWRAGDRQAALKVAQPPAVDALFAHPPGATQGRGCDTAQIAVDCAYRLGNNLLTLRMAKQTEGWVVDTVEIQ